MGIEPTLFAWEARVLPLNDTRVGAYCSAEVKMVRAAQKGAFLNLEFFP